MEDSLNIKFLEKPNIKYENLSYIVEKKEIYVNIFEFNTARDIKIFKYPFTITPEIDKNASKLLQLIFRNLSKKIQEIYGVYTISGNSLYSMKKISEIKSFNAIITSKGKFEYHIEIQKYSNEIVIQQKDVKKDSLTKQFIEIIIKDILKANPSLDFDKGLFVLKADKKRIETSNISINYYPGFIPKFIETEKGNFINVYLKNKIESTDNILDYLESRNYKDKNNQDKIQKALKGRWFYFKKKYKIDEILFDRNPINQTIYIDGKNMNIKDYYLEKYNTRIKNLEQPLILNYKKGPQDKILNAYYIPELCNFSGLDEIQQKDNYFMKELSKITKISPDYRVNQTNKFLELLMDNTKKKDEELSPKEKLDEYGIIVSPPKEPFYGYLMEEPLLLAGQNKTISAKDKIFPLLSKTKMISWLCLYEKSNYNDAETLYNCLSKASKAYGLRIEEPEWVEMGSGYVLKEWINCVEEYLNEEKSEYTFVVFLTGKNNKLYDKLKKHSLCENGYVSQVIKATSLKSKGMLSICSKILLQINAKLGGISYKAIIPNSIKDRNIMAVGVDSSRFDKRTAVAMVSTLDNNFTNFYNKETIINEEEKESYESYKFCVSSFLDKEAIPAYEKKNGGKKPKNIIIYRQGVSDNILDVLKEEIWQIEQVCKNNDILFYYILVNTRTTFKFFEIHKMGYCNPGAGLLVIDGITQSDKFEFFIQPQQVTGGSATPTRFYVAYGNMDFPEIIPKFTYDLCHIYSNWQGTVRIPNVIKAAEKLSKITVKSTKEELNEKLNKGQSYL